jgi:hypothetical protein
VQYKVAAARTFVDVFFDNRKIFEIQRQELRENVVVITA